MTRYYDHQTDKVPWLGLSVVQESLQIYVIYCKQIVCQSKNEFFFCSPLIDFMTSGPAVAMEIMGTNVTQKWRELLGPTSTAEARSTAPNSIRAMYGSDDTKNAAHGSDSADSAARVWYVNSCV